MGRFLFAEIFCKTMLRYGLEFVCFGFVLKKRAMTRKKEEG